MKNPPRWPQVAALAACLFLTVSPPALAAPVHDHEMAILGDRLFPALTSFGAPEHRGALAAMLAERRKRMDGCGDDARCVIEAATWSDSERDLVAGAVDARLSGPAGPGARQPDDGLRAEALRELAGLNNVLKVYGQGAAPRYPQIDGPDDAAGSQPFNEKVSDAVAISRAARDEPETALDPSIALALALLDVNDRDYVAAFAPAEVTYNAEAVARARTLDWSRYRYTAIILPGIGPEDPHVQLSATGKLNVRLAAEAFAEGLAPFIITTGGSVHPRRTQFTEAVEMRRALIERYGVPADSIVVEPYARHTTTNLRNVTRRLMALHAPLGRDALIVSNANQSQYIESPGFEQRNLRELGYLPGKVGQRVSPFELTFRPSAASSRIDPMDPLDP